jgi:hypothetical protein
VRRIRGKLRETLLDKLGRECQNPKCKGSSDRLCLHHKIIFGGFHGFYIKDEYIDLFEVIQNLSVLCNSCHTSHHNEWRFKKTVGGVKIITCLKFRYE